MIEVSLKRGVLFIKACLKEKTETFTIYVFVFF